MTALSRAAEGPLTCVRSTREASVAMTSLANTDLGVLRRADERRFSVALGVSLVIHAIVIAALRGLAPVIYASPQAGLSGFSALQAVIAGPKTPPTPAEPAAPDAPAPELVAPPETHPVVPVTDHPPPPAVPLAGSNPARLGPNTPQVSIAVGTIDDPSRLGPDFVARLAQRFPERAAKPPMLLGSPMVAYPQEALESGAERRVAALLTLRANGSIEDMQLVREDPLFGPVVLDALKNVQFAPAEIDGNPVPYWAIVEVVFSLGRPTPPPFAAQAPARRGLVITRPPVAGSAGR
jgi:periplasmic protein TonB